MDRISVIIPCYNVERWIDRCMASIAAQTIGIDNLEIICVDDASTDATWEHLQKWEENFPEQIILIHQDVNRRQGAARNVGLQYSSADWIAFVDADDWLEPDYFEQLYLPVETHICDVVVCNMGVDHSESLSYFKEREGCGENDQYIRSDTIERKKEMLLCRPLGYIVWAKLIRKKMLLEHQICFPEGLAYEDNYWTPLLHIYADSICIIKKKLYHWFVNASSTMHVKNEDYHIDRITIQLIKWEDYGKRGLLQIYREELEYDLLHYAICFMKTLVFLYDQPPFSYYLLQREVLCQRISELVMDQYVEAFSGMERICFEALYHDLDREGFQTFVEQAKRYHIGNGERQKPESAAEKQGLRIVMFYSETESFNFFTDRLKEELEKRGHEIFICDLEDVKDVTEHSYQNLNRFISQKVDVVICFDGIGTREDQFIRQWNRHQAVVIDILMDPPFRFHPTLEKHPEKYQLFCCDLEHVEYVKKYFYKEVPAVAFMPHVGTMPKEEVTIIPYEERKYDILFSGSYMPPDSYLQKIEGLFPNDPAICKLYQHVYDALLMDSRLTIEAAVLETLSKLEYTVSDNMLKMLFNRSLYVDWAIRMHHRGRVVAALAEAGFDLYLLGQGWGEHPSHKYNNVHWVEGQVSYERTLEYMGNAKINLNVMPWFKAGTHDRIFNALLKHSVSLTDPSTWLTENFTDGVDIALYDLDHLEQLPGIVHELLVDTAKAEAIIQKGYAKVSRELTWSNCAEWVLETAEKFIC